MPKKNSNNLDALQLWYQSQCDGDWEHRCGITIATLDNPGWAVKIDLMHTQLQNKRFEELDLENTATDWIQCNVENNQFQGFGGPTNLDDILQSFDTWSDISRSSGTDKQNNALEWIQSWYQSQCNGDWEHAFGVTIETVDNPGWCLTIDLIDTNLEGHFFNEVREDKNEHNWFFCLVKDNRFEASCSPSNLDVILHIFRQWVEKETKDIFAS